MDQHTKSVGITLTEFNAAYQPERNADGSYHQREWTVAEDAAAITAAHAERRAWTMLDEDVVVSGVARANRSFYIITAHPYIEGERIEVSAAAPDLATIGATIAAVVDVVDRLSPDDTDSVSGAVFRATERGAA